MIDGAARRLAAALERRGLAAPAGLLADAHGPLAPLLEDLSIAFGPLAGIVGGRQLDDLRAVLESPRGLDVLADQLSEASSEGPRAGTG